MLQTSVGHMEQLKRDTLSLKHVERLAYMELGQGIAYSTFPPLLGITLLSQKKATLGSAGGNKVKGLALY